MPSESGSAGAAIPTRPYRGRKRARPGSIRAARVHSGAGGVPTAVVLRAGGVCRPSHFYFCIVVRTLHRRSIFSTACSLQPAEPVTKAPSSLSAGQPSLAAGHRTFTRAGPPGPRPASELSIHGLGCFGGVATARTRKRPPGSWTSECRGRDRCFRMAAGRSSAGDADGNPVAPCQWAGLAPMRTGQPVNKIGLGTEAPDPTPVGRWRAWSLNWWSADMHRSWPGFRDRPPNPLGVSWVIGACFVLMTDSGWTPGWKDQVVVLVVITSWEPSAPPLTPPGGEETPEGAEGRPCPRTRAVSETPKHGLGRFRCVSTSTARKAARPNPAGTEAPALGALPDLSSCPFLATWLSVCDL